MKYSLFITNVIKLTINTTHTTRTLCQLTRHVSYKATVNETGNIHECEQLQHSQPPKKTISHRYRGLKIPTIVNGIVNVEMEGKPFKIKSNISPKLQRHSSKPGLKVNIIGDSHLKGAGFRLNHHLNTRIEVCSLIK